jgi:hypothetical protein
MKEARIKGYSLILVIVQLITEDLNIGGASLNSSPTRNGRAEAWQQNPVVKCASRTGKGKINGQRSRWLPVNLNSKSKRVQLGTLGA